MSKRGPLRAADIMRREVVTVPADLDVWSVARLFAERRITGAPVVGPGGEVLGVVSQTDIVGHLTEVSAAVRKGLDFFSDPEPEDPCAMGTAATARDLMSADVVSASPRARVSELGRLMLRRRVHRVVIVERGRLLGIVTTMDIIKPR